MKTTLIAASIVLASAGANATNCNNGVQKQLDDLKAGLHQAHFDINSKYADSWGLEDRANIAKLQETKLDKSVFTADQQRQDEHINAVQGAAQSANEKADGLAVRADGIERQAGVLDGRVGAVEARADSLEEGQRQQDRQMESDRQQSIDRDAVNATAITAESQARAEANVKLAAGISTAQSTGDYAVSRSDTALRNAATNAQAIRNTNAKVAEHSRTLANHEQRLGELERNTSSRFSDIDKRIDENKRSANAGIAAVAAFANIPQVTGGARFSAGVGVGQRGSEQAVAVGFSSQLTDSVIGKVSVANDSQQQWTVGAGLAVQW